MRRFLLIAVMLLVVPMVEVEGQNSFWSETVYQTGKSGGSFPYMEISATSKLSKTAGFFSWSLVSETWSESIVGAVYTPKPWVEFDLGVGVETADRPLRGMALVWVGNNHGSFYTVYENGGSGYWYLAEGNIPVTSNLGVGVRAQRFVGIGPRFQITKKNIMFWVVPVSWDTEKSGAKNTVVALRFSTS